MRHFDGEIEKLIRGGIVEVGTHLSGSTNAGNRRLGIADFLNEGQERRTAGNSSGAAGIEIER